MKRCAGAPSSAACRLWACRRSGSSTSTSDANGPACSLPRRHRRSRKRKRKGLGDRAPSRHSGEFVAMRTSAFSVLWLTRRSCAPAGSNVTVATANRTAGLTWAIQARQGVYGPAAMA